MDKIQKFCFAAFIALCGVASYATENGVPKCDTVFTNHLDASKGECK